jgi:hypothetical protein
MKNVKVSNEKLQNWALSQLKKKTAEAIKNARDFMEDPREHWKDEKSLLESWWIRNAFSKRECAKLESMTYDQILNAYKARRVEEIKKESERTADEINIVCAASMPEFIDVTVEWKKSRTWGANPRAEVRTGENFYESRSIGGCGYDKESTATAECFNKDAGIKKAALVAMYKNAHLPKNRRYIYGVNFFYCHAPYFEGGCGFSCHRHVLELAGYKLVNQNGGKMFNTYYFA